MDIGQPRRKSSATSHVSMHSGQDEDIELLQDGDNAFNEPEDELGRKRTSAKGTSRWLRLIGLAFATFLLIAILLKASSVLSDHSLSSLSEAEENPIDDFLQEPMLGIQLHPEQHQSRSPTTITHYWNVTSGYRSPDGVKKLVYLINDEFPGPTIECLSGDRLVIHVTNSLQSEGVSIHWHGLEMRGANAMDGAVGFTQCPISPGTVFTYDFMIAEDQAGTFWWHAHSQVQRGDGMFGGLVVHKPIVVENEAKAYGYDDDVLVMVGDWYHRSAGEVLAWYTSTRGFGNEPVPDSLLVNGAGKFICSMAVPARPVDCVEIEDKDVTGILGTRKLEKSVRLRLVNVGTLAGFSVQTSAVTLRPIAIDGGFPVSADAVDSVGIIYPGERLDVVIEWAQHADTDFPQLHISLDPENFNYPNKALRPNQSFPFLTSSTPTSISRAHEPSHLDLATVTAASSTQLPNADQTLLLYTKTQKLSIDRNHPTGYMNRTSWAPQSSPPFPLISLTRSQWDDHQFIPHVPTSESETWVEIIINNLDDGSHPFHLHGYSFYVLASFRSDHGWGSYSPYATSGPSAIEPKLNHVNPVKKDTVSVPRRGYVVIRFRADNAGIWMLHCHVLFHQASGMAMGIQVGGTESHEVINQEAKRLCKASSLEI